MRRISATATVLAALTGALALTPAANAAGPPMSVRVSSANGAPTNYFQVTAHRGSVVRAGTLKLGNTSSHTLTVLLDPVQGLTASTLGSAYGLRGSRASGPASWIGIGQRRVVLPPHGTANVPVTAHASPGAGAGQYLAGIGVQAGGASSVQTQGSVQIQSIQRYAVGVEMTVPGAQRPHVKLTGARLDRRPAGVTFSLLARNDGNVILKNVRGQATITSAGKTIAQRPLGPGTFVTGTSIAYPILVPTLTAKVGTKFTVRALLRYPGGVARMTRTVEFGQIDAAKQQAYGGPAVSKSGSNHLLLIVLIIAALACLAALEIWRRRRSGTSAGAGALGRALPREIAQARASGEPLNVILVPANGGSRKLEAGVRECLRSRDQLFEVPNSGLMVVSPDTGPEAGEMLAADIRRTLAREGSTSAVVAVANASEFEADQLLRAASATGNGSHGNGGVGKGGTDGQAESLAERPGAQAPGPGRHDRAPDR